MKRLLITLLFLGTYFSSSTQTDNPGAEEYKIQTVVIDAGHGGHDSGCLGASNYEKTIALKIALKVGAYIEKYLPEVKVIYTRKTDVFVELHERAAIANKNEADVFISIHCNAIGIPSVYGTETYVMGLHRTEHNLDVAKRENAVILLEEDYKQHYEGFDPNSPEAHIAFSLYQNAYLDQSIMLASLIEDQFKNRAQRKSRGVRQAGFLVLYKTTMPSVLVETGFLTNKNEEKYLSSSNGQDYTASAIFRAFRDYKKKIDGEASVGGLDKIEEKNPIPDDHENNPATNKTEASSDIEAEEDHNEKKMGSANDTEKEDAEASANVAFKIQIASSANPIDLSKPPYNKVKDLHTDTASSGVLKYLVGSYSEIKGAVKHQKELRELGFQGAFVVSYHNGERISVQEAMKLINH